MLRVSQWACVLALLGANVVQAQDSRSQSAQQYSANLWNYINRPGAEYTTWKPYDYVVEREFGIATNKHAKVFAKYVAKESSEGIPHGALLVTQHFSADGKKLQLLTAWFKNDYRSCPRNNDWYWTTWLPNGTLVDCSCDDNPNARRGFVTTMRDNRLWIFRSATADVADFFSTGELAKNITLPSAGPGGVTVRAPDNNVLLAYKLTRENFVCLVVDERLWVFKAGSPDLIEFMKNGELAKNVTRIAAGPNGITIKAPDAALIDAYLKAADGDNFKKPSAT